MVSFDSSGDANAALTGCQTETVAGEYAQNKEEPSFQALKDVDKFLEILSTATDKSHVPEFPCSIESLLKRVETMISDYDSRIKFGKNYDEDSAFVELLVSISKLINVIGEFGLDFKSCSFINQASSILHVAMSFLDTEFCTILQNNSNNGDQITPEASKQSSFGSYHEEHEKSMEDEECAFPGYLPEAISTMRRIATAMILLGYENECCMVYNTVRRSAFNNELDKFGYETLNIEDVQRMQWETLEGEVSTWINTVKHSFSVHLSEESKLCNCIFSEYPSVSQKLFSDLSLSVLEKFLGFAVAVALTTRSSEKLFKLLDMYETLQNLIPAVDKMGSSERAKEIKQTTLEVKDRIGQIAMTTFCDLESSIKRDQSKTPVPGGAVHPLTRYTINYLKYACEYKDTLDHIFKQKQHYQDSSYADNEASTSNKSPFSAELNLIMDLLDENLESKSNLYRDPSLRYIFLMNNGRYILQKIKGANEIYEMMGAIWCRQRSCNVGAYHKSYTKLWTRLLQCLNPQGLQVNGKVLKPVLKERFKAFNSNFDEIHKTQSTWVVSDEQLRSELRVSISSMVVPAYRSFLGRFQQYFTPGRQTEKHVKYQPEDLENLTDGLFDGNTTSMVRKR